MITRATLMTALRTWLYDATGLTVIDEQPVPTGPRPNSTYCTVKITGIRHIGHDDYEEIIDPEPPAIPYQKLRGDRVITVSVNVIGPLAMDKARDAMNAINKETVRDKFRLSDIAVRRVISFEDLTGLLDTKWEPRAHFTQEFGISDRYTDDVGLIEHVEATETYTTPNTTIVNKFTVN